MAMSIFKYFSCRKQLIAVVLTLFVLGLTCLSSKPAAAAFDDVQWLILKNEGQQRCLDFGVRTMYPILYGCSTGSTNQRMMLIPQADNQVIIINQAYGMCLDTTGNVVFKATCSVYPNEQRSGGTQLTSRELWSFQFVRAPFKYQMVSKATGNCLQFLHEANPEPSDTVLAPCDSGNDNQLWSWTPA
jgi:hypothetical protein